MVKVIVAGVLAGLAWGIAQADTITLANGRKLYGKIISENEKEVTLNVSNAGTVTVKRKEIEKIEKDEKEGPHVLPPSESPLVTPASEKKGVPQKGAEEKEKKEGEKAAAAGEEVRKEEIDPKLKERIEALAAQLGHRQASWRSNARVELVKIGKQAVAILVNVLESGSTSFHRWGAAQVLGDIGDERATEALVKCLRDADEFVRKESNDALKKITRQDFGYDPLAGSEVREAAARKWEEWWQKQKEKAQEEVPAQKDAGQKEPGAARGEKESVPGEKRESGEPAPLRE